MKLKKLLSLVLMLALAICQVPGRIVLVGSCEMECCKSEASDKAQLAKVDNCCCTTVEVKHHAEHPAAPSPTVQVELEPALLVAKIEVQPSVIAIAQAIPIARANSPPADPPRTQPPSRAPPIS